MIKFEIKDSRLKIDISVNDKIEAFTEFFMVVETIALRLHAGGADKKDIIKTLKLVMKEVKQDFPKFNEFAEETSESNVKESE